MLSLWLQQIQQFIEAAYAQTPVLVLALSLILVLPLLVLLGWLSRLWSREDEASTQLVRSSGSSNSNLAGRGIPPVAPPLPAAARIEVTGAPPTAANVSFDGREMLRLGREDDNDVCLNEATVHRYHAVIKRSVEAGYVISDISTSGGNGVFVNGQRTSEARLEDGDEINLGTAKLIFRSDERPVAIFEN